MTPPAEAGTAQETPILEWRRAARERLLAERRALSRRDRQRCAAAVTAALSAHAAELEGQAVGFYWPMKGEIDLVAFIRGALERLAAAALPVIVAKNQPLEFWRWTPRTQLCNRGLWHTPSPAERVLVEPDVLLVPMLGFDANLYRLGYGGGAYHRTLAALPRRPRVIGIGYELGRLGTIHPEPLDVRMDAIATERGVVESRAEA